MKTSTDSMPKALVRVEESCSKRVIFRLKDVGFNSIINVHHFASQIIDYLKENDNFGLDIKISDETSGLLETGGGIKKAIPLFNPNDQISYTMCRHLEYVDLKKFYSGRSKPVM